MGMDKSLLSYRTYFHKECGIKTILHSYEKWTHY